MHILSPETDNCPSWISGRERMTVENISWSVSTKEYCQPPRGLNPRPPGLQSSAHPTEPLGLARLFEHVFSNDLSHFVFILFNIEQYRAIISFPASKKHLKENKNNHKKQQQQQKHKTKQKIEPRWYNASTMLESILYTRYQKQKPGPGRSVHYCTQMCSSLKWYA